MHDRPPAADAAMAAPDPAPQAFWDQRFSGKGFLFGKRPNAYLAAQQRHLQPACVLWPSPMGKVATVYGSRPTD